MRHRKRPLGPAWSQNLACAYADGTLDAYETHLIRKIAALLHVPDSAYIAAKMRAKEAAGE